MCALFIGPATAPTRENIKDLRPVLVSKTRVGVMLDFLLTKNPHYMTAGVQYSPENLADLYPEHAHEAVPVAIEICCLPDAPDPVTVGYADRGDLQRATLDVEIDDGTVVVEAVGYTIGENTPQDHRQMKAAAVAWCLDKKSFVKMQTGSKFITDRDPGLLTFTFPALDPWGIGGFHEPNRTDAQYLTFERQTRNMLLQHDRRFQQDPNFAYVSWNIIQKKEVNKHVAFRTDASSHATIVKDIADMGPALPDLMAKWELNPNAKPSNKAEKRAMRTLNKLKLMAKDLKGSSGYKQCRRNEIRAMMKKMATPALFMTLNPADICDPLLGAMGGIDPAIWAAITPRRRLYSSTKLSRLLSRLSCGTTQHRIRRTVMAFSAGVVDIMGWSRRRAVARCIVICLFGSKGTRRHKRCATG
ncbi:hypothetical protein B0H15DRAFT_923742 [Mycena belliarum]|uniref:Helitron helicase-like domain-containing protein n=1 Tax=Mycena belliarum TaxID=1033014 RepID=A0AAD6XMB4_9AGAR|nr:hypothetical protein B0H15DRAFT_923742 [Mycena belliae]